jgi:5-methylcytosine-specific restriction endonuclease McrA
LDVRDRCLDYNKQYSKANKEIIAKQRKQHYDENREVLIEKSKQYQDDNKEATVKRLKQWKEKNKEHCAEYGKQYREGLNKETYNKSQRQYQKEHPEKFRGYYHKRNALKLELLSTLTPEQWGVIKQCFNSCCAYCGKEAHLEQEHFIALSKGGEYTHNNILPACKNCNSSKNNKDFFEWYPKYKYYSKKREKQILEFLNYKNGIHQLALAF